MEEAMTILKAAAHPLDQQTGLSFHGPPTIAHLVTMAEPMVSFIKRFQNRSRETGPAEPCKHAACSRTHLVNECCICPGPHFVHRC
jgi:hypothetical protein